MHSGLGYFRFSLEIDCENAVTLDLATLCKWAVCSVTGKHDK